jgi:GT2 family glycosyltransferase
LVGNWNNCVKLSRGEWIKFVFQDDVIKPSCLEKLLAACQCENMPFGFCERDFIFEEGTSEDMRNWFVAHKQRLESDYQCSSVINPEQVAQIMVREPWHNLVGEPTVTLIKKLVFQELGGFDEGLVQLCDAEFWCRILINYGAAFVPESLAVFRIHAKAVTISNHQKRAYRMEVLDSLLLRYRFAFGRHFKALRNSRLTGKSTLSLRKECAVAAARAWRQARREDGFNGESLIGEWRLVKSHCPGLQAIACIGYGFEFMGHMKRIFRN